MISPWIRSSANASIILYSCYLLANKFIFISDRFWSFDWFFLLPVIIILSLDIYFLSKSWIHKPKEIDNRLSTFFISVASVMGFAMVLVFADYPVLELPYLEFLKRIGIALNLLPYPLIIWALLCLRDCLTVLPEAHKVIAHGIYEYSRHPLYVCYMMWAVSYMLLYPSIPIILSMVAVIGSLLIRIKREEALLLKTFPEYRDYYESTGLIGRK